jgi:hypothetical protein
VLRLNGREPLFGEARECTGTILLLFDCGGEEKMAQSDWHFPRARHGESGFVRRSKQIVDDKFRYRSLRGFECYRLITEVTAQLLPRDAKEKPPKHRAARLFPRWLYGIHKKL